MWNKLTSKITKQNVAQGLAVAGAFISGALAWTAKAIFEKGRDVQRHEDSCETVRILQESGHDNEEIIQIIQKQWDYTRSEVLELLDEVSQYNSKEK